MRGIRDRRGGPLGAAETQLPSRRGGLTAMARRDQGVWTAAVTTDIMKEFRARTTTGRSVAKEEGRSAKA